MKVFQLVTFAIWIAAILAAHATFSPAAEPDVGELTRELIGEKPAAQRTPEQLDAVYGQVIAALMPDMGNDDPGKRGGPQGMLERIAFRAGRPGAEAERAACAKAIAVHLTASTAPLARVWLLRQLERIGLAESVPAVAKLLSDSDPVVRDAARRALQKNSASTARAALKLAILGANASGSRAALINALSAHRDPSSLQLLAREAASDQDDVGAAAVLGLAKLGDKSSAAVIAAAMTKGSPRAGVIATDAYLLLADALAAKGDKAAALDIYKKMLPASGHVKCAAIIGIGRSGTAAEVPLVLDALADQDAKVRGACVESLCLFAGNDVTAAIAAKARDAKLEVKPGLLQALARRGDKSSLSLFIAAAEDADDAVRLAALAGLGRIGNPTAVPILLKAAATTGKPQEIARQSLQSLPGGDIDQAILIVIADKEPPVRIEAVRALAARHVVAATRALLAAAEDSDAGVRNESLKALGVVAPTEALAPLAAVLVKTADDGSRNEAAAALVQIANRDQDVENRTEPILRALAASQGPAKLALLGVLGRVGGPKSLNAVCRAVKDGDEKVRDAAVRALAEWPDAAAAEDLLTVARTATSETHQVLAIRGYIRVCRIRTNRPEAETAKLLAAGLATAKRPDEKRQALGGLAEVRDLLALQAVVPCMSDKELAAEAAHAAVRIGRDLCDRSPDEVRAAMEKVLAVATQGGLKREAQETLDRARQRLKEIAPKK